ncbi:hypothetical protein H5410_046702 [Solanum commersonii]|uniref:Uncharacterized protein n=1 Tax=Solanum commersonii TaxID=4109 RepID=A0A9J5XG85_SOLCO|nr:hypothetical protein H5410_046702 [Solanum commersonii]
MPKEKDFGDIVKGDVPKAIYQFFITGTLLPSINTSAITLVPKVPSPTKVKDDKPRSCCTSLYKIISKVLAI